MSPDRLKIARRFVACRHWRWLPGMFAAGAGRVCSVSDAHMTVVNDKGHYAGLRDLRGYLPDLDDDLTRLGVLAVVRAAWGSWAEVSWSPGAAPFVVHIARAAVFTSAASEEAALLAALEAAP